MSVSTNAQILIVEDDQRVAAMLKNELSHEGHNPTMVHTGTDALLETSDRNFDVIILDLNLPDLDGIEVAERLKKRGQTNILMLTARGDVKSRVEGLYAGASDYLTKPFSLQELLARVHVRLREQQQNQNKTLEYGEIILDLEKASCSVGNDTLELTAQEFKLLELLLQQQGKVFSRQSIEERIYDGECLPGSNTVEVFISSIRRKLKAVGQTNLINTVRGIGYVIR